MATVVFPDALPNPLEPTGRSAQQTPPQSGPTLDRLVRINIGGDLAVEEVIETPQIPGVTYELREDGGFELREDGGFELRDPGN